MLILIENRISVKLSKITPIIIKNIYVEKSHKKTKNDIKIAKG